MFLHLHPCFIISFFFSSTRAHHQTGFFSSFKHDQKGVISLKIVRLGPSTQRFYLHFHDLSCLAILTDRTTDDSARRGTFSKVGGSRPVVYGEMNGFQLTRRGEKKSFTETARYITQSPRSDRCVHLLCVHLRHTFEVDPVFLSGTHCQVIRFNFSIRFCRSNLTRN